MVSDDTEHTAFVAQALIRCGDRLGAFQKSLARSLRWWVAGLPAGVGFATLRSIIKLWFGWPPERSGVNSAGNGPAMRSAILGVAFGQDREKLKAFVKASTQITHRDPKAYFAALTVAVAAIKVDSTNDTDWRTEFFQTLEQFISDDAARGFLELVEKAMRSAKSGESVAQFADSIGSKNGISGYCYHTVPCVLHVWFQFGDDLERGLPAIISAGGDTDTAGAIFGGIVSARAGKAAKEGVAGWHRRLAAKYRLARSLGLLGG